MTPTFLGIALCFAASACSQSPRARPPGQNTAATAIRHIIIVIQENRSFDNLFHGFPGSDYATSGLTHNGLRVALRPISLRAPFDLSHLYADFWRSYDRGRMDGFDLSRAGKWAGGSGPKIAIPHPQYAYVPRAEIQPYWALARRYALADHMFQANYDESFAAHLYLIAAQAGGAINTPNGHPWGCDAAPWVTVQTLRADGTRGPRVFPCFSFHTLADDLNRHKLTWTYYAPRVDSYKVWRAVYRRSRNHAPGRDRVPRRLEIGQLWSAFDAIAPVRYGPAWSENVVSPPSQFFRDIGHGMLANVTWIVPDYRDSDHSGSRSASGPDWVGSVVNAVGASPYWKETAIFIVWDDSGGWYDHVPPPRVDFDGLGFRVPLIVVSPYAKRGYVSHRTYSFGSILRFIEDAFSISTLTQRDAQAAPLSDMFDFKHPRMTFQRVHIRQSMRHFVLEHPSDEPPDTE